jgi:hypothetical protein
LRGARGLDRVAEERDEEKREKDDAEQAGGPLRPPIAAKRPRERAGDQIHLSGTLTSRNSAPIDQDERNSWVQGRDLIKACGISG